MSLAKVKVYIAWFCPFAQRAWIALLHKRVPFEYVEQNPYDKTAEWLAISRQGLVPAIVHGERAICQSDVCVQYVDEAWPDGDKLLPVDPYERAVARMWVDHIEKSIVPNYYAMLIKRGESERNAAKSNILNAVRELTTAMNTEGPFFFGKAFGYVDIMLAPFAQRIELILRHYRDFEIPEHSDYDRYQQWWAAVRRVSSVAETFQPEEKLIANYKRYADNTAKTMVADAIRQGTNLP